MRSASIGLALCTLRVSRLLVEYGNLAHEYTQIINPWGDTLCLDMCSGYHAQGSSIIPIPNFTNCPIKNSALTSACLELHSFYQTPSSKPTTHLHPPQRLVPHLTAAPPDSPALHSVLDSPTSGPLRPPHPLPHPPPADPQQAAACTAAAQP